MKSLKRLNRETREYVESQMKNHPFGSQACVPAGMSQN